MKNPIVDVIRFATLPLDPGKELQLRQVAWGSPKSDSSSPATKNEDPSGEQVDSYPSI